jgi:cell filamentation protein
VTHRYDASALHEGQFEPGSNHMVLRNKLGITSPTDMDAVEAKALVDATGYFVHSLDAQYRFVADDLRQMHRKWLGGIYDWAGEYRKVNMGKGGFAFAAAHRIPQLMEAFEVGALRKHTPCAPAEPEAIASALAETHVEFVLIHPFREGNGRCSRLLSVLMALQAGLPFLDFSTIDEMRKPDYFVAVRNGLDQDYSTMTSIFRDIIRNTIGGLST